MLAHVMTRWKFKYLVACAERKSAKAGPLSIAEVPRGPRAEHLHCRSPDSSGGWLSHVLHGVVATQSLGSELCSTRRAIPRRFRW